MKGRRRFGVTMKKTIVFPIVILSALVFGSLDFSGEQMGALVAHSKD